MRNWIRLICVLLAVLMLSGCGLFTAYKVEGEVEEKHEPADSTKPSGGIYIYDDSVVFAGGKLDELMDLCEEVFIGEADRLTMEDAAAAAIIESLGDRWSYYIPASEYNSYVEQMANAYVGVGITIQIREDEQGFDIVSVEKTGPAYEAGLLPGDVLVGANDVNFIGQDVNDASAIIKGEEGTTVDIHVQRDGKEMTFTVERRTIEVTVAEGEMLPGNVGLVTIANFDSRCASESIAAIESLMEQGATSLIFDVRYNPGGYAHELVALLDYLLPEGELFIGEDYLGNRNVDSSDADCLEIPMVVLVNGDSFSAAEFFAAALRDYEWATIIGEQTVGKGYFQQSFELSDGSAVSLSVGKYFTPGGVSLAEVGGLTPDTVVKVDDEMYLDIYYGNVAREDDPQIQAALEALKAK
ncbi:MAG: PDZ domain-containing protein [Oscillospiraceae bacterium]|nr:PDZ domain-containing protein [Oscillospiraceae bacterium]